MFQEAVKLDDFKNWKSAGRTQFFRMGKGREMYLIQILAQKLGTSPRFEYQYRQVQSLVAQLLFFSNVFRPLIAFEQVLLLPDKKKLLNRIYNIMLEAEVVTESKTELGKRFGYHVF